MTAPLLALLALALTGTAPEEVTKEPRRNTVSVELPGLLWNGVELVGERLVHSRVSLLFAGGARTSRGGDFSTLTLATGVGARFWLNRFQLFTDLGGPLVGVRLDAAWTRITPWLWGTTLTVVNTAVSLRLGYRFVLERRVELTPEVGLAISMGLDRVPTLVVVPRPSLLLGFTAGIVF